MLYLFFTLYIILAPNSKWIWMYIYIYISVGSVMSSIGPVCNHQSNTLFAQTVDLKSNKFLLVFLLKNSSHKTE